jgi:hypothetical protein
MTIYHTEGSSNAKALSPTPNGPTPVNKYRQMMAGLPHLLTKVDNQVPKKEAFTSYSVPPVPPIPAEMPKISLF